MSGCGTIYPERTVSESYPAAIFQYGATSHRQCRVQRVTLRLSSSQKPKVKSNAPTSRELHFLLSPFPEGKGPLRGACGTQWVVARGGELQLFIMSAIADDLPRPWWPFCACRFDFAGAKCSRSSCRTLSGDTTSHRMVADCLPVGPLLHSPQHPE